MRPTPAAPLPEGANVAPPLSLFIERKLITITFQIAEQQRMMTRTLAVPVDKARCARGVSVQVFVIYCWPYPGPRSPP